MKRTLIVLSASLAAISALSSCGGKTYQAGLRTPETTDATVDTISYAVGMDFGRMIKSTYLGELDMNQLVKGMNDVLFEEETMLNEENVGLRIQNHIRNVMAYMAEKNLEEGNAFLAANKEKEGVIETESGLQYIIETQGTGIFPEATDTVEVHYRGTLLDGTVFDSSYDRGEPVKFPLNRVIAGWSEGLTYANEGSKIKLFIPADLGYGSRPSGPIPGNSLLIFDVELLKVSKTVPKEKK